MGYYLKRKGFAKTAEPIVIAGILVGVLQLIDVNISEEALVGAVGVVIGIWRGIRNYFKNR